MKYTGRKGWQASYMDTWSLDATLRPIILAGLLKFREVMDDPEKEDWVGYPSDLSREDDEKGEKAYEEWKRLVDKMIYAFDASNTPERSVYNFGYEMVEGEKNEEGLIPFKMVFKGEEFERDRYKGDMKEGNGRVQEGRN